MILFRQMQTLTRMEKALATATERLEHTRSVYNELQAQVTMYSLILNHNTYNFIFHTHRKYWKDTRVCGSFVALSDYFTCPNKHPTDSHCS